ncbi:MAG: tetratricopeptide repeat protein [Candidatus Heimdallarchaeota archaeon]|nr:tetratricopeptide repeat protein [Candidatus Heimdallarchaeota archaeon]MCK4955128.1 tetratricopeptide repeat protein [Candidatus Heimdallarchaeota archaeon]
MFEKVQNLIREGKLTKSLKMLDTIEKNNKLNKRDYLRSQVFRSEILIKKSNYGESLQKIETTIQKSIELEDNKLILDSLLAKIKTLFLLGELEKADETIQTGFKYSNLKGKKKKEVKKSISTLNYYQGEVYYKRGEIEKALNQYQKTLASFDRIDDQIGVALVKLGIGDIFCYKGEIEQALKNYEYSLGIFDEQGYETEVVVTLNKISRIYHITGDLEDAIIYYKVALNRAEKTGDTNLASGVLLDLISLLVDGKLMDNAEEHLINLKKIKDEQANLLIDQRYKIAEGIILKNKPRLFHKIRAQENFREITQEDILDNELSILASFYLLESLILELSLSGNIEVLEEANNLLKKLHNNAENQNSYSLLAKTYLLKSKIALLELKVDEAKSHLNTALSISQSKGLTNLAMLISSEHDNLLNQLNQLDNLIANKPSFRERIEVAQIERIFDFMVDYKQLQDSDISPEKPLLVMLVSDEGMTVYANYFDETKQIDDILIGGFLSAINSFSKEVFDVSGSLERIKHHEYTILVKNVDKFLFCYIYEGQSYYAIQKLEDLINWIQKKENIWRQLKDFQETRIGLDTTSIADVSAFVNSLFLEQTNSIQST